MVEFLRLMGALVIGAVEFSVMFALVILGEPLTVRRRIGPQGDPGAEAPAEKGILFRRCAPQHPNGADPNNVIGVDRFRDPFLKVFQRGFRLARREFSEPSPEFIGLVGGDRLGRHKASIHPIPTRSIHKPVWAEPNPRVVPRYQYPGQFRLNRCNHQPPPPRDRVEAAFPSPELSKCVHTE